MQKNIEANRAGRKPVATYHEKMIKGTLHCVTSVYQGKVDLKKALQELTVRKILEMENGMAQTAADR